MNWLARIGWAVVALLTLSAAAGVYIVNLPEPSDTIVLDHAVYQANGGREQPVILPNTASRRDASADTERYALAFDLAAIPEQPLFLFIPAANRSVSFIVNGEHHFISPSAPWSGAMVRRSVMVHLPRLSLRTGRNALTIVLSGRHIEVPAYLSKMYIGPASVLVPYFRLRVFFEDRLKTLALAAHVLMGIGVLIAYFYRPKDPLFSWLAATTVISLIITLGYLTFVTARAYVFALTPAAGFVMIGLALSIVDAVPPRLVRVATWLVPAIFMLALVAGFVPSRVLAPAIALSILIGAWIVALTIIARGALRREGTDARLMLVPLFLSTWYLIRDAAVTFGFIDGSLLFSLYVRPVFLAVVMAVLMRRLAMSLDGLDHANENLNRRLAEQENELSALHRAERIEAARLVREQERQRLTHDLHDGISGHLVSIIAMTEQAGKDVEPIERAARQALEDLRLVIYSLDLGDQELPLALANFRERLIPQLRRAGVELDWSTANLPEISGVTPSNALSILRILQEALTNAIKHGPARRIEIRGSCAPDGMIAITVENDSGPFIEGRYGLGLQNMRRRAKQLHGDVRITPLAHGTKLTVLLPSVLPKVDSHLNMSEMPPELGGHGDAAFEGEVDLAARQRRMHKASLHDTPPIDTSPIDTS